MLKKCPKSLRGNHLWGEGKLYDEKYPIFGLTLFAVRKFRMQVIRCQACGVTEIVTNKNTERIKKLFEETYA